MTFIYVFKNIPGVAEACVPCLGPWRHGREWSRDKFLFSGSSCSTGANTHENERVTVNVSHEKKMCQGVGGAVKMYAGVGRRGRVCPMGGGVEASPRRLDWSGDLGRARRSGSAYTWRDSGPCSREQPRALALSRAVFTQGWSHVQGRGGLIPRAPRSSCRGFGLCAPRETGDTDVGQLCLLGLAF